MAIVIPDGHLAHYGIPKMRWGVRRFQNEDGSLTEEGRKRYGKEKKSKTQEELKEPPKQLTNEEIIKSGDAQLVLSNADRLSTQELQAARTRLNELNTIRNMTMGEIRQKKEHVIKRGAKLIGKAIADQTADSLVKATKGVTAYGIKKGVNRFVPEGEWKRVIISSLNSKDKKQDKNQQGGQ